MDAERPLVSTLCSSSHSTGVRPAGAGSGIPRARQASAKGPSPPASSRLSASDSARCTAMGKSIVRAHAAAAA